MGSVSELRVLFVDDSVEDVVVIERHLRRSGFDLISERVESREAMSDALSRAPWDAVISDHLLPMFSQDGGLQLLRESGLDIPFIVVSGAIGEEMAVDAMRAGAHDYVMKGNLSRLVPALEREIRDAALRAERREADRALVRAEVSVRRLAAIVESSDDAIVSMTLTGAVETWNPGAERPYGYSAAEMAGRSVALIAEAGAEHQLLNAVERAGAGNHVTFEMTARRMSGAPVAVTLTLSPIRDQAGNIAGISAISRDMTDRRRFETQLRHLADHDGLTGLFNRRRFEDELVQAVSTAGRHGILTAVAVIDVDHFKYVNDTLGHRVGDELIREIGTVLAAHTRDSDVVARLGGDEFAILLPHVSATSARAALEQLLARIRERVISTADRQLRVTASAGVVTFCDDHLTADELLAAADLRMYDAKEAGRDRLASAVASTEASRTLETRLNWVGRIRDALEHDRFTLYLQPILDLASGHVTRHEVLLRMLDDHGEIVAPNAFLPTAERFGLIEEIDRWVVRNAIALLARERHAGRPIILEVNLSGRSVDDPTLLHLIETSLEESRVDPASLTFEITETAAITNMNQARTFADRLTSLGCQFALDDFGAGFASFYYLKHLPLQYVKIDGSFIQNLRTSPTDQLVVKAMVKIAQGMGLKTIAEFVEDAETLGLLGQLGVDYAQGYHVGRPRPSRAA